MASTSTSTVAAPPRGPLDPDSTACDDTAGRLISRGDSGRPSTGPCLEPVPVDGCDVCAALVKQREAARGAGNPLTVRSRNAELANHPHRRGART